MNFKDITEKLKDILSRKLGNIKVKDKDIFIVNVDGELFIKKILFKDNMFYLRSLNKEYKDIKVKKFRILGKVKGALNKI